MRGILFAAAFAACGLSPAFAQDADEIVVTAQRYRDAYEDFSVPSVSIVRRADFAVASVVISSDTRDASQRNAELRQALTSLTRYADRNARVSVALIEEDEDDSGVARVIEYTVEKAMLSLRSGSRPDTSAVTVTVRTRVSGSDNLDAVDARFDDFAESIPKPGRVEVGVGEVELTLTDPHQYREQVLADIARDAAHIATLLGVNYGARLEGLENPIAWRRAGDLNLRLFVPYRMVILPRESGAQ